MTSGVLEGDIKLSDTTNPTLIMQGTLDDQWRPETQQALYDAIPDSTPKQLTFVEGAHHGVAAGAIPESGFVRYVTLLQDFFNDECIKLLYPFRWV